MPLFDIQVLHHPLNLLHSLLLCAMEIGRAVHFRARLEIELDFRCEYNF